MNKNTLIFALGFIPLLLILVLFVIVNSQNKQPETDNTLEMTVAPTNSADPKDTIRTYFSLINNKEIDQALSLLSTRLTGNDVNEANPVIKAYKESYANWAEVELLSIAKAAPLDAEIEPTYIVTFNLKLLDPEIIGNWNNGENARFITLSLEQGEYKIVDIATGP